MGRTEAERKEAIRLANKRLRERQKDPSYAGRKRKPIPAASADEDTETDNSVRVEPTEG